MLYITEFPISPREYEIELILQSGIEAASIFRIQIQHESNDKLKVAADFASVLWLPSFVNSNVLLEGYDVLGNPNKLTDIADDYSKTIIECDQPECRISEFSNAYFHDNFYFYTALRDSDEFEKLAGRLYVNDWLLSFWPLTEPIKALTDSAAYRFEVEVFANLSNVLCVAIVNVFDHRHMEIYTSDLKIAQAFNERLVQLTSSQNVK